MAFEKNLTVFSLVSRPFAGWLLVTGVLHLAWEVSQLRLYTLWFEADAARIVYALLHCTVGDVLISAAAYGAAAVMTGDPHWPQRAARVGMPIVLGIGLVYTAGSEWVNVYYLKRWAYTTAMPLIGGIGITPLLQWVIVPLVTLWLHRRWFSFRGAPRSGVGNDTRRQGDTP